MTVAPILLGDASLRIAEVVRAAQPGTGVAISPAAFGRIAAAEAVAARHAASGQPVYGMTTGLGGNLGHREAASEDFQAQIIRGRTIGLGPDLPPGTCRAAMVVRLAEIVLGTTGISVAATQLLTEMVNREVVPVLPGFGSIGASDLGIMAALGAVMIGRGEAWCRGTRMPGGAALAAAGLAPLVPGPKDGLALIGHGAATLAGAAIVLHELRRLHDLQMRVLALAMEGYAANPAILDPRIAAARPAPGQAEAAARLRALLEGSGLHAPGAPRSLQDALCFRVAAPVMGTARAALDHAVAMLEIEVNGATTSPIVLAEAGDILSSPNFHGAALPLALDGAAQAMAHAAQAAGLRIAKLMTARFSGLPAYLSPVGGRSAGYVSLQKTTADLLGEIRAQAIPAGMEVLAVSDGVEDMAPMTPQALRRLERLAVPCRWLVAIEALAAAQAADLRGLAPLGAGTAPLHASIRARVPPLTEDREPALDVEAVAAVLDEGDANWPLPASPGSGSDEDRGHGRAG